MENTARIFDVIEQVKDGITVKIEFQPYVNAALVSGRFPFIRFVSVTNNGSQALPDLMLRVGLELNGKYTLVEHSILGPLDPGQAIAFDEERHFNQFKAVLASCRERTSAMLTLNLQTCETGSPCGPSLTLAVEVSAANEYLNIQGLQHYIAAFVQPNTPQITGILRAASDLLMKKTLSGSIQGYQAGPKRAEQIAGALYEALRSYGITYINPPASFEQTGQKVRTSAQLLAEHFGTCIDLSVAYAACLEAAGLSAVIIYTSTHAFPGFFTTEELGAAAIITDANTIANLVEVGTIVPVEMTGIGKGLGSLNFRQAASEGTSHINHYFSQIRALVDIQRARLERILPLEGMETDALLYTEAEFRATRPFVTFAAFRNINRTEKKYEQVIGRLDSTDESPRRFQYWKRDLLDLSLRNPLLNLPRNKRVLDLIVPEDMLSEVDDVIHSGSGINLRTGIDAEGLEDSIGNRAVNQINAGWHKRIFEISHDLYSNLDAKDHNRQLREMKRTAKTLKQETGSNYLYLTLGTLVHPREKGGEYRAPLFLLPVKLSGNDGMGSFLPWSIKADGEEIAQPNLCLLEWLRVTHGISLEALANPSLDEKGLALKTIFLEIRQRLLDLQAPFRIDETCTLAILKFSTFQIWHDLDMNWRFLMRNPVVAHLIERPGETFFQATGEVPPFDEGALRLPSPADGSQIKALAQAMAGRSFVLEGPPGTGKSQTIANLIAHGIQQGKKILFVAAKEVALEVVQRKLDSNGIGNFILPLYGSDVSMNEIRSRLNKSLESAVYFDKGAYATVDAKYRAAFAALRDYPSRIHRKNLFGHSYWSSYDLEKNLGEGPTWVPDPLRASQLDPQRMEALLDDFVAYADNIGLSPHAPWLICGGHLTAVQAPEAGPAPWPPTTGQAVQATGWQPFLGQTQRQTTEASLAGNPSAPPYGIQDALRLSLTELRGSYRLAAQLPDPWRKALDLLSPGRIINQAIALVEAKREGSLPGQGHLLYIERPSWNASIHKTRSAIAALWKAHSWYLGTVAPGLAADPRLASWLSQVRALDKKTLFVEYRKKPVREAVRAFIPEPYDLQGEALARLLAEAQAVRDQCIAIIQEASRIPGLLLPPDWNPALPEALRYFERLYTNCVFAAWLSNALPPLWELVSAVPADDATLGILHDIGRTWDDWLQCTGADETSIAQWLGGRSFLAAWEQDAPLWEADVAHNGSLQAQRFTRLRDPLNALIAQGAADLADKLARCAFPRQEASLVFLRGLAQASFRERADTEALTGFDPRIHSQQVEDYLAAALALREMSVLAIPDTIVRNRPFNADRLMGEVASLVRQIKRKRGGMTFREITRSFPDALLSLCPCFMMSPGAVAHFLDAEALHFDMVIFDEASQIRVPQAIGAMGRGDSVIITGDSKQMPPTRIMETSTASDREDVEDSPEEIVDLESILTEAVESGIPQLWLAWHYRSKEESLIAFSNEAYYGNRLITLPEPDISSAAAVEFRNVKGQFSRGKERINPIEAQAIVEEIVARLHDPAKAGESLGVVCFNIQQRDYILDALENSPDPLVQMALNDNAERQLFVKNLENVQGDERDVILFSLAFSPDPKTGILPLNFGPLNVSGGERRLNVAITRARKKVLLFASFMPKDIDLSRSSSKGIHDLRRYLEFAEDCTIRNAAGNAGPEGSAEEGQACPQGTKQGDGQGGGQGYRQPAGQVIGQDGGQPAEVDGVHAIGQATVKGDGQATVQVAGQAAGQGTGHAAGQAGGQEDQSKAQQAGSPTRSFFANELAQALRDRGYQVTFNRGLSSFKLDLAIKRPEDKAWRCAIMLDSPLWAMLPTVADREGIKALLRQIKGWAAVTQIWLPGWVRDSAGEIDRLVALIEGTSFSEESSNTVRLADRISAEASAQQAASKPEPDQPAQPPLQDATLAQAALPVPGAPYASSAGMPSDNTSARSNAGSLGAPVAGVSGIPAFVPVSLMPTRPQSTLLSEQSAYPTICAITKEALATEGPVSLERLVYIIYKRCRYLRVGPGKQRMIAGIVRREFPIDAQGFLWPAGVVAPAWRAFRRTMNKGDRSIEDITLEEIGNAMEFVLRQSLSIEADGLISESARALGFERIGAEAKKRFESALGQAVYQGRFQETAGRLKLPA
ncbi:MAG: DUF4011 domain-containing protein [Coriobacteriaceae bacterium]|jgi:hypothetical protein|nr:DUF4011 domain-containing protein [Coriobacteriaceae bacterium]